MSEDILSRFSPAQRPAVPDVSLRFIVENPRWVEQRFQVDEETRKLATLVADRDLALANHETAGLALATVLHWRVLEDPLAANDRWAWAEYRAWLQLLKSLHGKTLEAALLRLRGEAVYVPLGIGLQQPQQQGSFFARFRSLLGGGR